MVALPQEVTRERGPVAGCRSGQPHDRLLWLLWIAFCVIMIGVAVRDYARGGGRQWWQPVLWEGSALACSTVVLGVQRWASPRFATLIGTPWRWFAVQLEWAPLVGVLLIASFYAIRHTIYAALGLHYTHEPWLQVFAYELAKFAMFCCLWLGVIFSLDSHAHWQAQHARLLTLQRSLSEARLAQLSAQLRPHFFFNALNTISALIHVDVARADRLLATLGELLRESLVSAPQQLVTLRRELQLLRLYAQVMSERFSDRVTIEWHIDESVYDTPVPALLLQPLLENAFRHGVERNVHPTRIRIEARADGRTLELSVANDGILTTERGDGIGLRNSRDRLAEIYRGEAELQFVANTGEVIVRVRLPLNRDIR